MSGKAFYKEKPPVTQSVKDVKTLCETIGFKPLPEAF